MTRTVFSVTLRLDSLQFLMTTGANDLINYRQKNKKNIYVPNLDESVGFVES